MAYRFRIPCFLGRYAFRYFSVHYHGAVPYISPFIYSGLFYGAGKCLGNQAKYHYWPLYSRPCIDESFAESVETMLQGITYDYVIDTMQNNSGSSAIRIIIAAVPVVLSWIHRNQITGKMINIAANMSLLNLLLTVLATFTRGLYVIRLSSYTNMYNLILYPYLLTICIKGRNRQIIKLAFYIFYFAFYVYQMSYQGAFWYRSNYFGCILIIYYYKKLNAHWCFYYGKKN